MWGRSPKYVNKITKLNNTMNRLSVCGVNMV